MLDFPTKILFICTAKISVQTVWSIICSYLWFFENMGLTWFRRP